MASKGRVVVGCSHGEEDPDSVAVAYLTAGAALDQGKEVVLWLTSDGVRLGTRGYADRIRVPVLLVAGTQDLHAPLDESQRMRDALVAAGNTDVHLEVLDGMGHFFEKMYAGYQHTAVVAITLGWLARTLMLDTPAIART